MCNPQTLISQNPCLVAYPPFIVAVIEAQGLCAIATGGFTPPSDNTWTNPQDSSDWTDSAGTTPMTNPQT
jgi:hypothetical protein